MTVGIAVLGGSNLGYCYAADLAQRGVDVTLWVRSVGHHEALLSGSPLRLSGVAGEHETRPEVTTDLDRALRHDLLLAGLPTWTYPELAATLGPRLEPRHVLVLTPGNAGSALFARAAPRATVAETAHPLYGARRSGPASVAMVAHASELPTGVLPVSRTREVVDLLNTSVDGVFVPARSVLDAALNNPNPIFHAVPCLLNVGWIEGAPEFHLYRDGMSPSVLRALYAVDRERVDLRERLGYGAPHYPQWTILEPDREPGAPHLFEPTTFMLAARSREYHGPHTLEHRFIAEDTSNLVLWVELARLAGVPAPLMEAVVGLFGAAASRDWWVEGRTLESAGLPSTSIEDVLAAVGG